MIKTAVLGAGRMGRIHAANVNGHEGSQLVAVSDIHAPSAEDVASTFGAIARTSEDIIADPSIDAIVIATATDTHADLLEAATAAGKAVLCEKPVDLSFARAKECLAKVLPTGQPVMIGLNRRFDPSFAALKAAADAGDAGDIQMLSIASFDPAPPPIDYIKVSGGLFRDMTIHDFDICQWVLGGLPISIMAQGAALTDPEIGAAGDVDTAMITLTYSDGRMAVIRNSRRSAYGYDQRVELLGTKGLLQVENIPETTLKRSGAGGVTAAKPMHFFLERYMPAYGIEWNAFITALSNGTPMPVTLEDGVSALAMAEAATKSLKTGAPVTL